MAKNGFADVTKDVEMEELSWIFPVSPKHIYMDSLKREVGGSVGEVRRAVDGGRVGAVRYL